MVQKGTLKTKMMLKCDDPRWNKVKKYALENGKDDLNDAVLELIDKGLLVK